MRLGWPAPLREGQPAGRALLTLPEVEGLPGGTRRGEEGEKGDRGHLGSPLSQTGLGEERWFMEAGITAAKAAAAAATSAAAATAWKKPHPSACSPGDSEFGRGSEAHAPPPSSSSRRPELPLAPPTLCPPLRLLPPPRLPAASQPRGRLLSQGSTVSMTPATFRLEARATNAGFGVQGASEAARKKGG